MGISRTVARFDLAEAALSAAASQPRAVARRAPTPAEVEQVVLDLYENEAPGLARYAATLSRNRELAQDAVQEAFLRLYVTLVGGEQVANERAWLYRVARNYVFDRLRNHAVRNGVSVDSREVTELAYAGPSVEQHYAQQEILGHARRLLSAREFDCLRLRVEGLNYREIAQVLDLRSGTVGTMLARGLKKLRRVVGL